MSKRSSTLDLLKRANSLIEVTVPELTEDDGTPAIFYMKQPSVADVIIFSEGKTDGEGNEAQMSERMLGVVASLLVESDGITPTGVTIDILRQLPTPISMRLCAAVFSVIKEGNAIINNDAPEGVKRVAPLGQKPQIVAAPVPLRAGEPGNDSSGRQGNS